MPVKFTPAPEVAAIATRLIPQHHLHLLACGVRVTYLFRDDSPKRAGKQVLGECKKISNLNAFLARADDGETEDDLAAGEAGEPFFVITIARPYWEVMSPSQREALVDHELCHALAEEDDEGNTKLSLRAHDVEEFGEIVQRHGLWQRDVERFAATCVRAQLALPLDGAPESTITINAGGREVTMTSSEFAVATRQLARP